MLDKRARAATQRVIGKGAVELELARVVGAKAAAKFFSAPAATGAGTEITRPSRWS
jgi:hypothetical protein